MSLERRKFWPPLILCLALLASPAGAHTQPLESKLGQQTDYFPQAASPLDRLIEVAQRFNIPVAVEWLERAEGAEAREHAPARPAKRRSVGELIAAVVGQSPEHCFVAEDGLLRVFAPAVASHPSNFLNIQVGGFRAEGVNLFDTEARLRTAINRALYPELFRHGHGGGYGYPPDHVFVIPNVTVSGENLNVRDVLNGIARGSGNALWVVRLRPDEFSSRRPYWVGKPIDEYGHSPVNGRWGFLPLAEVPELAEERVVVEITVEGFAEGEKVVIPIIAEHGLSANERGSANVFTTGRSYGYSVSVERVERDKVVLDVSFSLKPPNGTEKSTEETITVVRGEPFEMRLFEVGRLRAYIEATHNNGPRLAADQRTFYR